MKNITRTIFSRLTKPGARKSQKNTLSNITRGSQITLLKIKTVFPFTLFPDTLTIDLHKINIRRADFFLNKRINSINHEDILNIMALCGPIFATLKITTRFYSGKPIIIKYLKKAEALRAKRLIHGLIVAHRKGVSLRDIEFETLIQSLEQLGSEE